MSDNKKSYFLRRFENEIAAADEATCHEARLIHLDLALRYSMKASRRKKQGAAIGITMPSPAPNH